MKRFNMIRSIKSKTARIMIGSATFLVVASAAAGPVNVPFKASAATQEYLRPDFNACVAPPYLAGKTTGSGTASHLGAITLVATDCVTPGLATFSFSNGTMSIVSANGDEVKITYSGTLTPVQGSAGYSLYSIAGGFTVLGGTGRFAKASGSGYIQGSENIQTGQGQFELIGALSY